MYAPSKVWLSVVVALVVCAPAPGAESSAMPEQVERFRRAEAGRGRLLHAIPAAILPILTFAEARIRALGRRASAFTRREELLCGQFGPRRVMESGAAAPADGRKRPRGGGFSARGGVFSKNRAFSDRQNGRTI